MPRLWTDTVDEHRTAVRSAVLDAAGALAAESALSGITMSAVADRAGIGRATLYKYFPDVHAVLHAWHERQLSAHLDRLVEVRDSATAERRLAEVLDTYATLSSNGHSNELGSELHSRHHANAARHRLHALLTDLLIEEADAGRVRSDIPADELANYTAAALNAARSTRSAASRRRLVQLTLTALVPPSDSALAKDNNGPRVAP